MMNYKDSTSDRGAQDRYPCSPAQPEFGAPMLAGGSHAAGDLPSVFSPPGRSDLPRISGTAMPHGVFLSTGTVGTAGFMSLVLTGLCIVALGVVSVVPTYLITWLCEQHLHLSLTAMLLQIGAPLDPVVAALARIGLNLLSFLVFLVLLRATPLAGHHAAEHMTVHAIEQYGRWGWEAHVAEMPRAHARCGSTLLSGVLPTLIVSVPLLPVSWPLSALVALLGWRFRYVVGTFVQNVFTTKAPTAVQLARGVAAGQRLLERWQSDPWPELSPAQRLWRRGMPQMAAGVIVALWLLGYVGERLHVWLDW